LWKEIRVQSQQEFKLIWIAPWSMAGTTSDGQEIQQSGLSVAVLRRQADGGWKMVIDNPHGG